MLPGVETPRRGRGKEGGKKITDLLKPGQEIVVQVVKDPLKTKGARLSMELTIAGRYMVYAPTGEGVGVSKRLDDKERARLRREAKELDLQGGGAIIRTAAQGATRADFERELQYLFKLNEVLHKRVEETAAPGDGLPGGRPLRPRRARHLLRRLRARARRRREAAPPPRLVLHAAPRPSSSTASSSTRTKTPLFEAYGVEKVIDGLMGRRVDLPSGGYLMIDYAEALTVIDVNSGSFVGRGKQARLEDTILKTNLEAAEAVVNELRLRDIGGIIVIDFIDMARARNRDAVLKTLRTSLEEDRTKTFTAEISKLGLVEMTRQNVTEGVREIISRPVPDVRRRRRDPLRGDDRHRVRAPAARPRQSAAGKGVEAFLVQMNPRVSAQFTGNGARVLHALEEQTGRTFHFEGSEGLPLDHFAVTMEGARDEVEERAVPFREGDEVLVHIVEPHMYDVDDAVAKIDGYIVSVAGRRAARRGEAPRAHRAGRAHVRDRRARRPDGLRRAARDGLRRR